MQMLFHISIPKFNTPLSQISLILKKIENFIRISLLFLVVLRNSAHPGMSVYIYTHTGKMVQSSAPPCVYTYLHQFIQK